VEADRRVRCSDRDGALILALAPRKADPGPRLEASVRGVVATAPRAVARRAREGAPRPGAAGRTWGFQVAAPLVLGALGLVLSVPLAFLGLIIGLLAPHWVTVRYLTGLEARAAADDRAAGPAGDGQPGCRRWRISGPVRGRRPKRHVIGWVKADFNEVLGRYFASEHRPRRSSRSVRRQAGRKPRSGVRRAHRPDAHAPAGVSGRRGSWRPSAKPPARISVWREAAAAESRGLRVQAGFLALVIPGLFLYLLLANHALVAPVLDTSFGGSCCWCRARRVPYLEFAGVWLRLARDAEWRCRAMLPLLGALATSAAVFSVLMAIFLPAIAVPKRLDAVRAAALPRERYEKLVSSERPWWERVVAPVAGRLARSMPCSRRRSNEATIVRAGLDPPVHRCRPRRCIAAKLVLVAGSSWPASPSPQSCRSSSWSLFQPRSRLRLPDRVSRLPNAPSARPSFCASCPTFSPWFDRFAAKSGLEHAVAEVSDALHEASGGQHLLAEQVQSAVAGIWDRI